MVIGRNVFHSLRPTRLARRRERRGSAERRSNRATQSLHVKIPRTDTIFVIEVLHNSMSSEPPSANQQIPIAEPLVEVRRGAITESRHRGHVTVVTPDGRIVSYAGDPANVTFLRSSAKPLQAIPLLVSGAADRFGFTDEEVALACASHNGEPIHTEIVASMLEKIGLGPEALEVRRTRTL